MSTSCANARHTQHTNTVELMCALVGLVGGRKSHFSHLAIIALLCGACHHICVAAQPRRCTRMIPTTATSAQRAERLVIVIQHYKCWVGNIPQCIEIRNSKRCGHSHGHLFMKVQKWWMLHWLTQLLLMIGLKPILNETNLIIFNLYLIKMLYKYTFSSMCIKLRINLNFRWSVSDNISNIVQ